MNSNTGYRFIFLTTISMVALGIAQRHAVAQPDPLLAADFVSHPDSDDITSDLYFVPLAPQYSDYWREGTIHDFDPASYLTPLPPLPIALNIYSLPLGTSGNSIGSAISTNPLFWKGVYRGDGVTPPWTLYTLETTYPQAGTMNWHNLFQWSLNPQGISYPPAWAGESRGFTDWVDLYAPYLSRAFFKEYGDYENGAGTTLNFGHYGFPRIGSPQHVDLPPTYPPLTLDIWSSTSPLVPASGGDPDGHYLTRPSVGDGLDMITGEPLLTETDLELEFGSATFRRIRTYSEPADHGMKAHSFRQAPTRIETWARGWHGAGWMSSEAPLFYFDASQPGTISTGTEESKPVCYFVPDAHHSIPFLRQERDNGEAPDYTAPEWFDAMLLYDKSECEWGLIDEGTDSQRIGWITPPAEMKVYLHNRSVIYTIKMYYEDVDPRQHRRPEITGLETNNADIGEYDGVPYYGLVTSITDKTGNEVRITYVDANKHRPYLDTRSISREEGLEKGVMPVRQKGWYKGMIDHIKLYPSGQNAARWSLFYTYRTFYSERHQDVYGFPINLVSGQDNPDEIEYFIDYWDALSHPPALHSVLVYEGDIAPPSDRDLILACDQATLEPAEHADPGASPPTFVELLVNRNNRDDDADGKYNIARVIGRPRKGEYNNLYDYQDAAIGPTGEGEGVATPLPAQWLHQLRYSYADPAFYGEYDEDADGASGEYRAAEDFAIYSCGPVNLTDNYNPGENRFRRAAYLLKAARLSRAESETSEMQDLPARYWLYRYQDVEEIGADVPAPYPSSAGVNYWMRDTGPSSLPRRMSHRYGSETIDRIYKNRPDDSLSCSYNTFVNALIGLDEDRYVDGDLCSPPIPPEPPSGPPTGEVDTQLGGIFGYGDEAGPYSDAPGTGSGGSIVTSSIHRLDEEETNFLPIGLLADKIYYRWTQPYRLDPRLLPSDPGQGGSSGSALLIARPASWEQYDGRIESTDGPSAFNLDLRHTYVGGSISDACEEQLGLIITQAVATTGFLPGGAGIFSTVGDDGSTKWCRVYRFISAPESPVSWRGSAYEFLRESGDSSAPSGPEVIWDDNHEETGQSGEPGDIPVEANATHALYYYPFNFVAEEWGNDITDAQPVRIEQSRPMWWVAVDEYDSIEEALSINSSMTYSETNITNYMYDTYSGQPASWNSRRVVGLSSTGAVLSDRTWTNDEDQAVDPMTQDPPALLEAWAYDCHMRPILKFSRGWGAAAVVGDESTTGLVESFVYGEKRVFNLGAPAYGEEEVEVELWPRTPLARSIRKGCSGIDMPVSLTKYLDEDTDSMTPVDEWRARLPEYETFYGLDSHEIGRINHYYGHWDATQLPNPEESEAQPPMRWKIRSGPAHRRRPGGPLVHAIDAQWYNNKGQLVWRVYGAVAQPQPNTDGHVSVSEGDEVFLDYYQYDEDGRQTLTVEDISINPTGDGFTADELVFPGHPTDNTYADLGLPEPAWATMDAPHGVLLIGDDVPGDDVTAEELGLMVARIIQDRNSLLGPGMYRQAQAEPLNLITFRDYNNFGQFKVVHPSGARDITHYRVESNFLRELRAMGASLEDGAWNFSGQGLFNSEFEGQNFVEGIQSVIDGLEGGQWSGSPYDLQSDVFLDNRLEIIANITPNYDTAGRLTGLTIADTSVGVEPLKSTVSYDGWGNPLLEISPDRLIKRYRYDGLGRLHKTFVGSTDRHYRWRTATEEDTDDDMILTEKLYYGTSPNDAFMPITKWMYRQRSTEQYGADWWEYSDDQHDPTIAFPEGDSVPGRSSPGLVERYGYDWRMRRVITRYEDFAAGNPGPYREERTYLDNLDRVRFVAVYAPQATAAAPDPDIAPFSPFPEAGHFLGAGPGDNLLSLEETVYNDAGQVVERRRYDPSGSGGYLATHSYTDHEGRAIWSSSSGGEVNRTIYDAKGRVARSLVYAGDDQTDGIEMSRSINTYGPDGHVLEVRSLERTGEPSPSAPRLLDSAPHRQSRIYTWYDSSGRVIATADMGWADFDGTGYERTIPPRPEASPEHVVTVDNYTGHATQGHRRILVGVDYPDSFFDPITGDALARVTCYWYDRLGKQNAVLNVISAHKDPATGDIELACTIDRTEYNRYGQKVMEHEYAYSGDGSSFTHADFTFLSGTEYTYEADVLLDGHTESTTISTTQVRSITPVLPEHAVIRWDDELARFAPRWTLYDDQGDLVFDHADQRRTTILEYGAPIIQPDYNLPSFVLHPDGPTPLPIGEDDWSYLGISNRPDLIKAVHLPDPTGGGTGDGLGYSMFFFYYPDGLPAIRVDSRGVGIKYVYDADGNLIRLSSDDANIPLLAEHPTMADAQRPPNAIEYTYDALSRLMSVTTGRDFSDGTFWRRSRSDLLYTSLGNLDQETQRRYAEYDDPADPDPLLETAGVVDYTWDTKLRHDNDPVDHTNNVNRLLSITYPDRAGTHDDGAYSPRVVTLGYGAAGGVSDLLDRVESLTSTGGPQGAELGHVATYRYDGISRLGGVDLGDVPGQSSQTYVHTDDRQFDLFGRVVDRQVMSFDVGSGQHQQIMHSQFGYDLRGDRLYERLTQLDHPTLGSRDNTRSSFFDYDALGRLAGEHYGTLKADGFEGIDHASSGIDPLALTYGLDSLNRRVGIGSAPGISIWEDADKDAVVDAGELLAQTHVLDARGGLTGLDDGTTVEPVDQDIAGAITELHGRTIYHDWLGRPILALDADTGDPIFAVDYDGFGRVAQRRAPWPDNNPTLTKQRIETYFYDGVRRIQEVFADPIAAIPPWPVEVPVGGLGGGYTGDLVRTEAEYIWSAASGQPFDTCHVQIDWWDREAWFVQDHQTATVRAYTDANGEMVRQYRFDAFGNLLNLDTFPLASGSGLFANFRNRIGHQGLFAERVDASTTATTLSPNPNAQVWYQNRSRWYVPELGRFMTSDPNATGVPTMSRLAMLGTTPTGPPSGSFDWESHYGDGWDTWTAYGANPVMGQDPSGLFLALELGFDVGIRGGILGALNGFAGGAGGFLGTIYSGVTVNSLVMGAGANALIFSEFADIFGTHVNADRGPKGTVNQAKRMAEKGQAPGKIGRIDKGNPNTGTQTHTHRKGQGEQPALNQDGTIHDKRRGDPGFNEEEKQWLRDYGVLNDGAQLAG